jgi:hypothetical protein
VDVNIHHETGAYLSCSSSWCTAGPVCGSPSIQIRCVVAIDRHQTLEFINHGTVPHLFLVDTLCCQRRAGCQRDQIWHAMETKMLPMRGFDAL